MTALTIRSQSPRLMVPVVLCLGRFHLHTYIAFVSAINGSFLSFLTINHTLIMRLQVHCVLDFKLKIIHTHALQSVGSMINRSATSATLYACTFSLLWMKALSMNSCSAMMCSLLSSATNYGQRIDFIVVIRIRLYFGNRKSYRFAFSVLMGTETRTRARCRAVRVQ